MKRIAASLAIAAAALPAHAFEWAHEMYIVGMAARTIVSQDNNTVAVGSTTAITSANGDVTTLSSTQSSQEVKRSGYKLQLGYEFSPYFAVEGGYVNLGKMNDNGSYATTVSPVAGPFCPFICISTPYPGPSGSVTRSKEIAGWTFAGLGIYPVSNKFSVFGKAGLIDARVKYSSTASTGPFASSTLAGVQTTDSRWKGFYGVGATFFPHGDSDLGLRLEYERFNKIGDLNTSGTTTINLMSLGLSGRF